MLSNSLDFKKRVYSICEKSGDIVSGAVLSGVIFAVSNSFNSIPAEMKIICCGKVSESELLFRTENGQYYFSVCDGWGENNGILYGIRQGIYYNFDHSTTTDTIASECDEVLGTYHSWGGALAYRARKNTLNIIRCVMEKYKS